MPGLASPASLAGRLPSSNRQPDWHPVTHLLMFCRALDAIEESRLLSARGGVGAQYTPAAGWAQAIGYPRQTLGDVRYERGIALVLGGDASVATAGF